MKKYIYLFHRVVIIAILFVLISCSENNNPVIPDYTEKFNRIQRILDSSWNEYVIKYGMPDTGGIALYVSYKGSSRFFQTKMSSDVNEYYHFRIASNTKVYTAAAIMLLHQRGLLDIDNKIITNIPNTTNPYIPNSADYDIPYKSEITIRQLMQHTAGVFDITNSTIPDTCESEYKGKDFIEYTLEKKGKYHQFTFDEMVGIVAQLKIFYSRPGEKYHYSNTGYTLLAKIIERVSGKSYHEFITSELLLPNNLNSTYSVSQATDRLPKSPYIKGYLFYNNELVDRTEDNMTGNIAEGNIVSTFSDMNKWIKLLITGKAGITTENIKKMQDYSGNPSATYGLGIHYMEGIGYGHTGAHVGYSSYVFYDPQMDLATSLLCNLWDYSIPTSSYLRLLTFLGDIEKKCIHELSQ